MPEIKRKARGWTILREEYFLGDLEHLGSVEKFLEIMVIWKWSIVPASWNKPLRGMKQYRARTLDLLYHVLSHSLSHTLQLSMPVWGDFSLSIFLSLGIKPKYWSFFYLLPWVQVEVLLHLLNSSLCANNIYMTANPYNFQLAKKGNLLGPCWRAQ